MAVIYGRSPETYDPYDYASQVGKDKDTEDDRNQRVAVEAQQSRVLTAVNEREPPVVRGQYD